MMNTPITDSVNSERYVDHYEGYSTMLNNARRLELDRAALVEALEEIANREEIEYGAEQIARDALSAARANFPTP